MVVETIFGFPGIVLASIFVTRVLPRNAGDLAEARAGWADLDALPDAAFAGAA